jgi:hypothetical protein
MVVFGERTRSELLVPRWVGIYSPLETPALAADFMRLFAGGQRPRGERVVEFYRRYGPLFQKVVVDGEQTASWVARLSPEARQPLSAEARLCLHEPLWWIAEQAREMRLFHDVFRALASGDMVSLRAMLRGVPQGEEVRGVDVAPTGISLLTAEAEPRRKTPGRRRVGSVAMARHEAEVSADVPRRPLTDEECRYWGYQLLAGRLNAAQRQSSVRWMVERDEGGNHQLVRGRTFPDLVVAMYLQLGEMVSRGVPYRTCQGCGGPFWSRGGKRKFCDARCGDAYRQRHFYRRPRPRSSFRRAGATRSR